MAVAGVYYCSGEEEHERLEELKSREVAKREKLQKEQIQFCSSYSSLLLISPLADSSSETLGSVLSRCWVVSVIT